MNKTVLSVFTRCYFLCRTVHPGALPHHRHEAPERRVRGRTLQPPDGSQRYDTNISVLNVTRTAPWWPAAVFVHGGVHTLWTTKIQKCPEKGGREGEELRRPCLFWAAASSEGNMQRTTRKLIFDSRIFGLLKK